MVFPRGNPRTISTWSVLARSFENLFGFVLCYAMIVDVRIARFRIDVVTNLHSSAPDSLEDTTIAIYGAAAQRLD